MKKIFFCLIIFLLQNLYAGELSSIQLDSLYNLFVGEKSSVINESPEHETKYIKCGFGLVSAIRENFNSFTIEQQTVLRKLLQRPEKETSIISPDGFFRIHYNTTGSDAPNYDSMGVQESVRLLAEAFDSSYNFEVGFFRLLAAAF